jgi:HTH-type transcriptional regulator/antitoxin HigA
MDIRPIRTEADYKDTLKEISALMESDPDPGTPEGERLDILVTLVQAYEGKHMCITPPDPVEAIKFRMEQSGLSVKDLEPIIGKSNRVYEVLSRKRPLTLAIIRRLHKSLGIPADVLIAQGAARINDDANLWTPDRRATQPGGSAKLLHEHTPGCSRNTPRAAHRSGKQNPLSC